MAKRKPKREQEVGDLNHHARRLIAKTPSMVAYKQFLWHRQVVEFEIHGVAGGNYTYGY
jgi:hypothetical protein